ncbi:zf-HC2 domain-containing protein [Paenibacillus sp. NPDC057967]|uniref:zf-HC2 domain-containing protein n=1 Tax=Paenibacillus sp. NPDC057967 TaxID=3346293 RepID=UPI0036DE5162
MSTSCNIVYDLLPLYVDGACSAESKAYVEEHLAGCPACRKKYEAMAQPMAVDVLLGSQEDAGQNEGVGEQQRDHAAKRVLRRIKRRWLLSLIPLLLIIPLLFLGINQYRGEGMSFTNLYDHYAASQFLTALEKRDYERAFSYLNMDFYYYDDIQEGLKHSADILAFKEESIRPETDENGRLFYTNGEIIYTEEQVKAIMQQYEEFPESRETDKKNAQDFIDKYGDMSYEQFYERSKANFIANMKEWERLGHTLTGHRLSSSYVIEYDGVTSYSFYLHLTDGKQVVKSGKISLSGNDKGVFCLTGGSYIAENDPLTPKLLESLSISDLK